MRDRLSAGTRPAGARYAYTRAEIAEAVDALVPAYEIADLRVPAEAPGLLKVADCVGNGAFIAGPAIADWRGVDLGTIEVVLSHNGAERARGPAARILGDPLMAVVTLANAQPLPAGGLKRGQIVTTGTCTTPLALEQGGHTSPTSVRSAVCSLTVIAVNVGTRTWRRAFPGMP